MVKPIGSSPQSTPVKTEVEQTGEKTGKEQTGQPNQPVPIYSAKAQNARKAEHSFAGQAQAMKLLAEFERTQSSAKNATPNPYSNFATTNQKDDSKK